MEIEFKFEVPPMRLAAVKAALSTAAVTRTHLQARYFDTADGALAAHGMVLRLRKEGRHWVQTVKSSGSGPISRLEHNAELGTVRAGLAPLPSVMRHHGTPVGKLLANVLDAADAPLTETFATDIWRLARHQKHGETTVEIALDVGKVMTPARGDKPARMSPVCELELELVSGDVRGLVELAGTWCTQHGLWISTLTKAGRGARLMAELPSGTAVKAAHASFGDADPTEASGPEIQRAVLNACLAQMLPNASELAAGSEDADVIHQLRIGIRRMRTALRELAQLGELLKPEWEAPLVQVFQTLGARRDRENVQQIIQPRLQAEGAPAVAFHDQMAVHMSVGDAVRGKAFQSALLAMIGIGLLSTDAPATSAAAPVAPGLDARAARRQIQSRLNKLHRNVVRDGRHFDALPADHQHQVRKRLKRLRYLSEFVASCFGKRSAARYARQLEPAQDALGVYCDEMVAIDTYRAAAVADPQAWFAVGWLSALRKQRQRDCRKALARMEHTRKFWKN